MFYYSVDDEEAQASQKMLKMNKYLIMKEFQKLEEEKEVPERDFCELGCRWFMLSLYTGAFVIMCGSFIFCMT